jgi:hypothetical protein
LNLTINGILSSLKWYITRGCFFLTDVFKILIFKIYPVAVGVVAAVVVSIDFDVAGSLSSAGLTDDGE